MNSGQVGHPHPKRVETIREAIKRSPRASTRRLSRELGIPRATVWKVLHFTLKKKAYRIQKLHKPEAEDYAAERARPDDTFEWQRDTPKVNVWVGVTKQTVYRPFMFVESTVTRGTYLDMLEHFLEPQLWQDGILGTVVYQQDGAPPHFALPVREYLKRTFPYRWIGRGLPLLWADHSPDLTPMGSFLWGFIKDKAYSMKVRNLAVVKQRIREACAMITVAMLQKVFRSIVTR